MSESTCTFGRISSDYGSLLVIESDAYPRENETSVRGQPSFRKSVQRSASGFEPAGQQRVSVPREIVLTSDGTSFSFKTGL